MAVSLSVAFNVNKNAPGFNGSITGLTGSRYSVTRIDVGGAYEDQFVRGQYNFAVPGSTSSFTDYECPIDRMTQYRIDVYSGTTLIDTYTTAASKIDPTHAVFDQGYDRFWIKNIADPTQSLAVIMGQVNEFAYEASILGEYRVLGRKAPVMYTDVWGSRRGDFPVYSMDYIGVQTSPVALEKLLTSGDPLLLQSALQADVAKDMYFIVTGMGRTQFGPLTNSFLPTLQYDVDFNEIDFPPVVGSQLGNGLVGDLKDDTSVAATTWNSVVSTFASWSEVLQNYI